MDMPQLIPEMNRIKYAPTAVTQHAHIKMLLAAKGRRAYRSVNYQVLSFTDQAQALEQSFHLQAALNP